MIVLYVCGDAYYVVSFNESTFLGVFILSVSMSYMYVVSCTRQSTCTERVCVGDPTVLVD